MTAFPANVDRMNHPLFERKDLIFWASGTVLVALFWYYLSEAVSPFLIGLGLAYILNPLVRRLQTLGLGRVAAVSLVILFVFFGLGFLIYITAPWIVSNVADFMRALPATVQRLQTIFETYRVIIEERLGITLADAKSQISVSQFASTAIDWLTSSLKSVGSTGQAVMSSLEILLIVPLAVFYFLVDWERMTRALRGLIPLKLRRSVFTLTGEIDRMIGGYFRGQFLVCVALGTFYAASLWLIGLRYGLVIGAISGLLSFIPFLGTGVCLMLSFGFAIAQFYPEWQILILIGIILALGQFLEGNVLTPWLVGKHVGLHPLAMMFGLIALGKLYGFVGLLLSVPLAGTIAIVVKRLAHRYRMSGFFRERG